MAIRIGHASIDENNKIKGGNSGDQTNKEVCIRTWYSKGWQYVLRPKTSTLAEKSALACEKGCTNNKIGYDQNQRNSLYKYAKEVNFDLSKITTKCECDCSSFMHVCAIAGGANLSYVSNGYTTSTMVNAFVSSGDYEKLTDSKYLTSDKYLKRGDILVKAGSHTVMVLEDGSCVSNIKSNLSNNKNELNIDGDWGLKTTEKSQKVFMTTIDGIISNQPLSNKKYLPNVNTSSWKFKSSDYSAGSSLVRAIQKKVGVVADGLCGVNTVKAIQKFLNSNGYSVGTIDGSMGSKTVKAWQRYINDKL